MSRGRVERRGAPLGVTAKIEEYELALEEDRSSPFSTGLKKALEEITVDDITEVLG